MALKSKKAEKVDGLEEVAQQLVDVEKSMRKLEEDNKTVFKKLHALAEEKSALIEQLKLAARDRSVVGVTSILISRPEIFVSVAGRKPSVTYDYETAAAFWPSRILKATVVKTIDPKAVEVAVANQQLLPADAASAMVLGEIPTPAVTVRLP